MGKKSNYPGEEGECSCPLPRKNVFLNSKALTEFGGCRFNPIPILISQRHLSQQGPLHSPNTAEHVCVRARVRHRKLGG